MFSMRVDMLYMRFEVFYAFWCVLYAFRSILFDLIMSISHLQSFWVFHNPDILLSQHQDIALSRKSRRFPSPKIKTFPFFKNQDVPLFQKSNVLLQKSRRCLSGYPGTWHQAFSGLERSRRGLFFLKKTRPRIFGTRPFWILSVFIDFGIPKSTRHLVPSF